MAIKKTTKGNIVAAAVMVALISALIFTADLNGELRRKLRDARQEVATLRMQMEENNGMRDQQDTIQPIPDGEKPLD